MVRGHADRAGRGVDDEAGTGHGRAQPAVVPHIAVAQGERAIGPERVVAEDPAMGVVAIAVAAPRSGVEIATVERAGVVRGGVQAVGIAGVVGVPCGGVVKRGGRVVAQPRAVEDALACRRGAGEGHVVYIASVEEAAVKAAVRHGNVGLPRGGVVKRGGRVVAHHRAVAVRAKIEVPPVEHGPDVHLHPQRTGVV